jgi:hypothetical protein
MDIAADFLGRICANRVAAPSVAGDVKRSPPSSASSRQLATLEERFFGTVMAVEVLSQRDFPTTTATRAILRVNKER